MNRIYFLMCILMAVSFGVSGQEKMTKAGRDSLTFAKEIMTTKEFKEEKRKMDSVFKANGSVAVAAFEIEMPDEDDAPDPKDTDKNIMTGFIKEERGAVNVIIYDVKYDRVKRRIISVNKYNDGVDVDVN